MKRFVDYLEARELDAVDDPRQGLWITTRIDIFGNTMQKISEWFSKQYGKMGYKIKFNSLNYGNQYRIILYIPNKFAEDPDYPQVPDLMDAINLNFG
jgi:hypothetical protein